MKIRHKKNKKFLFTKKEAEKFHDFFKSDDIETLQLGLSLFERTKVYKHYKKSLVYCTAIRIQNQNIDEYICCEGYISLCRIIQMLRMGPKNGTIRYNMKTIICNFTFRNRYNIYD